jgi:DNA-directed RNA polymerase specialized sigma24 family protein
MREKTEITQEDFDSLLGWLSRDAQEAGKKYEQIRTGLINYFHYRGCPDAEGLADETINRVAGKLPTAQKDENFKLANYFYSFAAKIYLEDFKKRKRLVSGFDGLEFMPSDSGQACEEAGAGVTCMQRCLAKHPNSERVLLLKYYGFDKTDRAERRKRLADEEKMSIHLLQTKVSRLKKILRDCLRKCMHDKKV